MATTIPQNPKSYDAEYDLPIALGITQTEQEDMISRLSDEVISYSQATGKSFNTGGDSFINQPPDPRIRLGGYGTDGKKFYDGVGATEHAAIIQPTIKFMEGMGYQVKAVTVGSHGYTFDLSFNGKKVEAELYSEKYSGVSSDFLTRLEHTADVLKNSSAGSACKWVRVNSNSDSVDFVLPEHREIMEEHKIGDTPDSSAGSIWVNNKHLEPAAFTSAYKVYTALHDRVPHFAHQTEYTRDGTVAARVAPNISQIWRTPIGTVVTISEPKDSTAAQIRDEFTTGASQFYPQSQPLVAEE
ncbi:MAG: hypothetical protein ACD_62C00075G0009 [uncultured bacterium]|nr:MAG: hypothetical protein ACD_62C00075G0009 [uncultured bacterium]HLD45726.1 hypothetical protein [bacterium]